MQNINNNIIQKHTLDTDIVTHPFSKSCIAVSQALKYISSLFIELALLPLAALLYPFGAVTYNPKKLPPGCKTVTILVHGFLHNSEAWFYIKQKLKQHPELGPIFTINLGSPFQSIEEYTKKLSLKIEEIRALSEGKLDVNLVGHSMGGLVCANYAINLQKERSITIKKIVTIASPLQGSKVAFLAQRFCPCAKEMMPDDPFIYNLNQKAQSLPQKQFFHIGCRDDLLVSKNLAHFLGGKNDREVKLLGHLACLLSPTVANYVIEGLSSQS